MLARITMPETVNPWNLVSRTAAELRGVPWRTRLARVLALLFVVIGSLDVVSTNVAQAAGYVEANPVIRLIQDQMGAWWAVPKVALHLGLASIILWLPTRKLLFAAGAMVVLYIAIVSHNFSLVT